MKLIEILSTGAIRVAWPTAVAKTTIKSDIAEPLFCANRCPNRECLEGTGSLLGKTCHSGFGYYAAAIGDEILTVYGIIGAAGRESIPPSIAKRYKDDLKGRGVNATQFQQWVASIKKVFELIKRDRDETISEALHPLHDTPKIAVRIRNIAESMIHHKPGATFADKLSAATGTEILLYKSAELLVETFDMLTIFFNPESAKIGGLRPCEPYKLLDKLSRLLTAGNQGTPTKEVNFAGSSHRNYDLYESFSVIPLAILNNAVKYSSQDAIRIEVKDHPIDTWIHVTSTGPSIDQEDIGRIFDRGFRGKYSARVDKDGMGIGLYVAKLAADANGLNIKVTSSSKNFSQNGIPIAVNTFSFNVRNVIKQ